MFQFGKNSSCKSGTISVFATAGVDEWSSVARFTLNWTYRHEPASLVSTDMSILRRPSNGAEALPIFGVRLLPRASGVRTSIFIRIMNFCESRFPVTRFLSLLRLLPAPMLKFPLRKPRWQQERSESILVWNRYSRTFLAVSRIHRVQIEEI